MNLNAGKIELKKHDKNINPIAKFLYTSRAYLNLQRTTFKVINLNYSGINLIWLAIH